MTTVSYSQHMHLQQELQILQTVATVPACHTNHIFNYNWLVYLTSSKCRTFESKYNNGKETS